MKILQINSHYNQGGAARIVACIHRQLLAEGVESYVAFGRGARPEENVDRKAHSAVGSETVSWDHNVFRFDLLPEVYWSALVSRVGGVHGWSNSAATGRLIRYIDRISPDVIHLHAVHGYYLNLPKLFHYINEHQIPCVWTFHDAFAFTGNCGYYFDCERWKTGCDSCPNIHTYPNSQWLDRTGWMWQRKKELFTAGDRKLIVTPSKWLTEEARRSFMGKYECMTIHNGIDTAHTFYPRDREACRRKYGFNREEKLILAIAVGFDDVRKGARYIIRLAENLGSEARVILIGWNEKKSRLPEGLANVITLPNTSDTEMLAEYYSMADVFVLPSLAENYATVSLEAMACGTPVVGFDAGGIPEQLTGGRGVTVKAGCQEEFDQAVRRVLWEEAGILSRKERAEVTGRENSTEKMTGEYMNVYKRLCAWI